MIHLWSNFCQNASINYFKIVKTCDDCRNRVKKAHQNNRKKYNSKYFGKYSKDYRDTIKHTKTEGVKVDNKTEEKKETE